jgi:hypothetical protein
VPSQIVATIQKVPTGGPYAYLLVQDNLGVADVTGFANFNAALDAVKAAAAPLIPVGENVQRCVVSVQTAP